MKNSQIDYANTQTFVQAFDFEKAANYLINDFFKDVANVYLNLINKGWFLWFYEGTFNETVNRITDLSNMPPIEQDQYLKEYIKSKLNEFKKILIFSYPNRAKQIEDAFDTHNAGKYYASIPTFILLAEGFGRDLFPGQDGIYAKKNEVPKINALFDNFSYIDKLEEVILNSLRIKTELTEHTAKYTSIEEKKTFNRHLILHGISDNYGAEINSFKAIALAYYVHESLSYAKGRISE